MHGGQPESQGQKVRHAGEAKGGLSTLGARECGARTELDGHLDFDLHKKGAGMQDDKALSGGGGLMILGAKKGRFF